MTRHRTAAALLLATVSITAAAPDDPFDASMRQGIGRIMRGEYAAARELFRTLTRDFPDHPAGPVMEAAVLHQEADDLFFEPDIRSIDSLLAESERRGRLQDINTPQGRRALSFVASGRGIAAVEASSGGGWLLAFERAVSSAGLAERILAADSSLADAGLPLGSYYYWKSRYAGILTWLPFVPDNRAEGIALLERCATRGLYQRHAAVNALARILIDAGRYIEAVSWTRPALAEYPTNRSLLRTLAVAAMRTGDYGTAIAAWNDVLMTVPAETPSFERVACEAHVSLADAYHAAGRSSEAVESFARARALERRAPADVLYSRWKGVRTKIARLAPVLDRSPEGGASRPPTDPRSQ